MTMQPDLVPYSNTITILRKRFGDVLHAIFEDWVDHFPDAIAVSSASGLLTYAEVEQRANQIAHALRSAGVQRADVVAVALERGPDLVCALVGILKSGAAFAALDPRFPGESLAHNFAAADCRFLLTRRELGLATALPVESDHVFYLDDAAWLTSQPVSRPVRVVERHDPACVLFTSGSTGQPKAVLYLHRNLTVRFSNSAQLSGLDQASVFSQSSPVTAIDAIDEILLPLISGGCTAILPYGTVTDPHRLIAALASQQVTHILLVPSLLRVILSAEEGLDSKLRTLRTWMVGGEPLTGALTRQFYDQLPNARLINFYGLTEGDATFHMTSPADSYDTWVPVGCPVKNTQVYLLDEQFAPVPEGKTGEIYLSGEGLFDRYLNFPELNDERWLLNPFEPDLPGRRLFRTGDLGRYGPRGEIEYLGRRDRLVKVRGFRVELGEVETILAQHPAVEQCIVIARQPAGTRDDRLFDQTYLLAYAVLKRGENIVSGDLRRFLQQRLPEFAVPAQVQILDLLPLSPNGKVDIQALSQMEVLETRTNTNYLPPRSPTERQLTQIWERALNYGPIGVADSFFEVGGDSLAAIDLMLSIEKAFQQSLPITALIQSPTIAGLAALLDGQGGSVSSGSLVPIRAQGSRPPLFCVHADGSVFIYRRFAKYLAEDIPIYGLQAHGLANPQHQPYRHVDEMAAHYIREIRTVQPRGPYHLCAFSAGGLIIFEMARQLAALGEEVGFLGLLDAYGPDYPEYLSPRRQAGYKMSVHLNTLRLHGMQGQLNYLLKRSRHRLNVVASKLFADLLLKLKLPMPPNVRYEYIADLIDRAAQNYPAGRTYSGKAVVFHALTQPEGIQPDPTLGWSSLVTGDLKIVDVIGTHHSIMAHEPHIMHLVQKIDEQLHQLYDRSPQKNLHEKGFPGRLAILAG